MPRVSTEHFTYYPSKRAKELLDTVPSGSRSKVINQALEWLAEASLILSITPKPKAVRPTTEDDIFSAFGISEPKKTLRDKILAALSTGEKQQSELDRIFHRTTKVSELATALFELQVEFLVTRRKGKSTGGRCPILWSLTQNKNDNSLT